MERTLNRVSSTLLVLSIGIMTLSLSERFDFLSAAHGVENAVEDTEVSRVLALSEDIAYGEYLAGECASCHSATAVSDSNVPVIHGAQAFHLAKAILEYRAGIRKNTTMRNVASALGDEEVAVLAHYLASQGGEKGAGK